MRRRLLVIASLALAGLAAVSCDDGSTSATTADAGAGDGGAPPDGGLAACLDRPDDLPRPPSRQLPCELLPPGFSG
jgi:hypothetical protein